MKNGSALLDAITGAELNLDLAVLQPGVPVRLANVGWHDYDRFLALIGQRHFRTSYADGEFEIVMPLPIHEIGTALIGQMVEALSDELELPRKSLGMSTLRRDDLEKGLEPDRCYYLENEPRVRGRLTLDFTVDPPPDLAIEVEVSSSVEKRMGIYAALRVPEVWRYRDDALTVNQLQQNGEYAVVERSRFFPQVPINELVRFVHEYDRMGERELMKSFREWVRLIGKSTSEC
jgi:Uma2 family endonuclease